MGDLGRKSGLDRTKETGGPASLGQMDGTARKDGQLGDPGQTGDLGSTTGHGRTDDPV